MAIMWTQAVKRPVCVSRALLKSHHCSHQPHNGCFGVDKISLPVTKTANFTRQFGQIQSNEHAKLIANMKNKNLCKNISHSTGLLSFHSTRNIYTFKENGLFGATSGLCSQNQAQRSFRQMSPILSLHTSCTASVKSEVKQDTERNDLLAIKTEKCNLKVPYIWLRDHCQCDTCYNHETNQKNADPDLLRQDLTPASVEFSKDGSVIHITWKDGHITEFTMDFLINNFYPGSHCKQVQTFLWNKNIIQSVSLPTVSHDDHMTTESGLKQSLSNLVKYGFTLVDKSPISIEGTRKCVERVSYVLETMFGQMWSFTADGARSDTAYSNQSLGAHTDTSYLTTPAGIQVFQCLEHTGSGGETLLVDGFHAMNTLRKSDPEAFEILRTTVVPHEYKEAVGKNGSPGYHSYSLGTTISTRPGSGELLHLRFNPYDRAPLNTIACDDITAFYEAYDKLACIIADKSAEFWVKLHPGSILFIDNWRVMHGRAGFDGRRVMCGCYLPRDEWTSRARVLGVL